MAERLTRIVFVLVLSLMFGSCERSQADYANGEETSFKNIVVIVVDDLGWADIGAINPGTFYETPNIDRLAKKGVLFTNAYAASPVCSPSRLGLLTGLHPTGLAATDYFHPPRSNFRSGKYRPAVSQQFLGLEHVTLAEALKDANYRTAFVGKWHLGTDEAYWPEKQGFDVNIGGGRFGRPPGGYFSPYNNPRLNNGFPGEYLTQRLTDETVELIDEFANENEPFLLYLSYYTVHTPLEAPAAVTEKYEIKAARLPEGSDFIEQRLSPTEAKRVRTRQNHPAYAAMIEELDRNVGRVLAHLEQKNLAQDTIIVFTSDNGGYSTGTESPTSNLPLRAGKGWLYEGGIRVPLIVFDPAAKGHGTNVVAPVSAIDILPTVLDLAGASGFAPSGLKGRSISAALDGAKLEDRPIYFHYPHYSPQGAPPAAAVRLGRYKLIQNLEDGSVELYDLERDIGENRDLRMEQVDRVEAMTELLRNWYLDTGATFLRPLEEPGAAKPWHPLATNPNE